MRRFFDFSSGSAAAVFGVPVYGDSSGRWWHRAFVRPAFRVGNRVRRAVWRLRYRFDPRHRYHVVDTGLPPGYHEPETLMLNAAFALLRRHVEGRMGGVANMRAHTQALLAHPDPNAPDGVQEIQADRQAEAVALYMWWTETLPALKARRKELMGGLYGGKRRMLFGKDEKGMARVAIRGFDEREERLYAEAKEIEARIEREEQEMLHRLVDVRPSLW